MSVEVQDSRQTAGALIAVVLFDKLLAKGVLTKEEAIEILKAAQLGTANLPSAYEADGIIFEKMKKINLGQ